MRGHYSYKPQCATLRPPVHPVEIMSWYYPAPKALRTSNNHPIDRNIPLIEIIPAEGRKTSKSATFFGPFLPSHLPTPSYTQLLATSRARVAASGRRPRGCWTRAAAQTRGFAAGFGSKPSPPRVLCPDNLRWDLVGFKGAMFAHGSSWLSMVIHGDSWSSMI